MANQIVKFWRGKRATYNLLKAQGQLDYWTRYSIIEPDGTVTEAFGNEEKRLISEPTGQILPVVDIVASLADIKNPTTGERYIVGHDDDPKTEADESLYYIYVLQVTDGVIDEDKCKKYKFTNNMSVRVLSQGLKTYQLVNGELMTYDDVDCGTF